MEIFSFYNAIFFVLFGVKHSLSLTEVFIAGGGALVLWLPLFILQGIGLYAMAKKRDFKRKWLAFVPFVNMLYIGRLTGDCFIFGHKMKRGGLCVMIAQIVAVITMAAYVVANTLLFVKYGEYLDMTTGQWLELPAQGEFLRRFVLILDGSNVMIGVVQIVDTVYRLLLLVLLLNFFRKYAPRQTMLFALISCIAPEARYIFIFVLRNRQAIDYEEYLRRQREEYMRRQGGTPYGPYYHGPYSSYGQSGRTNTSGGQAASTPPEDPFGEFGPSQKTDGENKDDSVSWDGLFD